MNQAIIPELNQPKQRLYFIDIARSIAILLMLEGHFVHDSLALDLRDESNNIYYYWKFIRGFTSPVFLTVTGIVFTYLLLGNDKTAFWSNMRVRKGLKRFVELLFWGYLLQYYAFHVLQCIGVGIFTIISLYGIARWIKVIPLWVYYATAGILLFISYLYFGLLPEGQYWPAKSPMFIQNIFHGKHSLFPLTPHMGYTMFGAMIGVILFHFKERVKSPNFMLSGFMIGFVLYTLSKKFLLLLGEISIFEHDNLYRMDWLFEKLGMVFMVLSILLALETYVLNIKKPNLFLKIGQNTLSIYIIHMIILYGSITGRGLTHYFHERLNAYQIVPYTLGFVLFFVVFVYFLDQIRAALGIILIPMKKITNQLLGIR
ncbi:MAG: hypothetical protein RLZZ30_1192 [Bacteroidota bacterium]